MQRSCSAAAPTRRWPPMACPVRACFCLCLITNQSISERRMVSHHRGLRLSLSGQICKRPFSPPLLPPKSPRLASGEVSRARTTFRQGGPYEKMPRGNLEDPMPWDKLEDRSRVIHLSLATKTHPVACLQIRTVSSVTRHGSQYWGAAPRGKREAKRLRTNNRKRKSKNGTREHPPSHAAQKG